MEENLGSSKEIHSMGWQVSLSILGGVGWLVFLIIWLFFFASDYSLYQNIAIVLGSVLVIGLVIGSPWAVWGLRQQTEKEKAMWKIKGFRWRIWVSVILFFVLMVFLILWFYVYADNWSPYQNFAIFIVSILIAGGIVAAMWAPWGMRYDKMCEDEKKS